MKRFASPLALACLFHLLSRGLSAGEEIFLPNGLATAKVGDWALYQIPDGYMQRLSIAKRTGEGIDAEVTVRIESILNDKTVEFIERVQPAGEPMAPMPEPDDASVRLDLTRETMHMNGKDLTGYSVNVMRDDTWLQTWYISPMVPIYGLVKCETDDGRGDFKLLAYHKN